MTQRSIIKKQKNKNERTTEALAVESTGHDSKKRRFGQVDEDHDPAKKDKVSVPLGKSSNFDEAPKKRRKGKRSKQKNIKKDNRPQHLKPTYLTPGASDFVQAKPVWAPKDRPTLKTRNRLQQKQRQLQQQQQQQLA